MKAKTKRKRKSQKEQGTPIMLFEESLEGQIMRFGSANQPVDLNRKSIFVIHCFFQSTSDCT